MTLPQRVQRLEVLIRLRKLYRNLLRADGLLAQPAQVYQPRKRSGLCLIEHLDINSWPLPGDPCILNTVFSLSPGQDLPSDSGLLHVG